MTETVCEDRISALPEDLLVTILLLVPTQDAVATMILSKRWRFIWMMLPTLEYNDDDDNDDDYDQHESKKSTWLFLNKSLELHKAPILSTLLIKLGRRCPTDANVGKWVSKAIDHGVIVLNLSLRWSISPTRLPNSLYTCETLTKLTLSHKILVDLPSSSSWLPSLQVLDLVDVVYKDETCLERLLSGCPFLMILAVQRNKDDNVTKFSVKVPSLRFFLYTNYILNDVVDTSRCLVIDTRALISFYIFDYSRDSCLIENLPCLEDADIDVRSFPDSDKSKTSLSTVLSLRLALTDDALVHCNTINFSRLRELSIKPSTSDWLGPLLLLLNKAPKLEDLLVDYESTLNPDLIPLLWNQPSFVPECLSSQLETFEWRGYGEIKEEEEFMTYILANSKCLKTVTISLRPTINDLEERDWIIDDLKDIPRVSTSCQLLFK